MGSCFRCWMASRMVAPEGLEAYKISLTSHLVTILNLALHRRCILYSRLHSVYSTCTARVQALDTFACTADHTVFVPSLTVRAVQNIIAESCIALTHLTGSLTQRYELQNLMAGGGACGDRAATPRTIVTCTFDPQCACAIKPQSSLIPQPEPHIPPASVCAATPWRLGFDQRQ